MENNSLKKIILSFVFLFSLTFIALAAEPLGICTWYSDGCERFVIEFDDGSGDSYVNCGGGAVYVGTGQYGGCAGVYEYWD